MSRLFVLLCALGLCAAPLGALAADEEAAAREDEMFGGEAAPPAPAVPSEPAPAAPGAVPEERPGAAETPPTLGPLTSGAHIEATLKQADNVLSIGGQLMLRLDYSIVEDTKRQSDHPLHSPNLLEVYLDARPNDRLRGYAKGRVNADFTIKDGELDSFGNKQERLQALLPELWIKFDIARVAYLTLGRQPLRWGSGHFWNPTDFVNQLRKDPFALFDERIGVDALKLHFPVESLGWNFYLLGLIGEAKAPKNVGVAGRAEFAFWQMEIALSGYWRHEEPLKLGADLSLGVSYFDFRSEVAVSHGVRTPFYKGHLDLNDLSSFLALRSYKRQNDWLPQVMGEVEASIPYGDNDVLVLGVEYLYNQAGYAGSELYPKLMMEGLFTPLYTGKHYGGFYLLAQSPGTWDDGTLILSSLGNLSDKTFMARAELRVTVLTYLTLNAYLGYHFGKNGELHYGLTLPPDSSGLSPFPKGLAIKATAVDLGLGFQLTL